MKYRQAQLAFWGTLLIVAGCQTPFPGGSLPGKPTSILQQATSSAEPLTVLSGVGGLCLIAGMILLAISRGQRGWYPVVGGVILVILNYMVAKYDDYLFYPLVVFTGMVSAAWTYKIVKQILAEKKSK